MDLVTLAMAGKGGGGNVPEKVSELENDAGYLTAHQSLENVNAARINGYTVVVRDSAPAAGTPQTQITIVT